MTYLGLMVCVLATAATPRVQAGDELPGAGDPAAVELGPELMALLQDALVGDVNHDGKADILDALQIARYSAGLNPENFDVASADVNGDGSVTILDALLVARWSAGLGEACDGKDNDQDGVVDEGCPEYAFFVFADVQLTSNPSSSDKTYLGNAITQMQKIDTGAPIKAVAGFSVGDLVAGSADINAQWTKHNGLMGGFFDLTAKLGGAIPAYFPVLGNHDGPGSMYSGTDWATRWQAQWKDSSLPKGAWENPGSGVYYSLAYQNARFVVLDSVNAAGDVYAKQTADLETALKDESSPFKFVFFHKPVYACAQKHVGDFKQGLRWIQLAEEKNAIIFNGHTHVYTRTKPLKGGVPTPDESGVTQIEVGTLSNVSPGVATDFVRSSQTVELQMGDTLRRDTYNCNVGGKEVTGANLANAYRAGHTFCHVQVKSCQATVTCYSVEDQKSIDTWTIDRCPR